MADQVAPKVATIAPSLPFADVLAQDLLGEAGGDPLALARTTLFVPTRRAARAMAAAFLRASAGRAVLLPSIHPLGDVDEDEALGLIDPEGAQVLPPAIEPLQRQWQLIPLVERWLLKAHGTMARLPEAALLAAELAGVIDRLATGGITRDRLADLVPADFAHHWQKTLALLDVVLTSWPAVLEGQGLLDPAERQRRLLEGLAQRWREAPPTHRVVAAGSTGSIPAVAALLRVIARLPHGMVILPGLDQELTEEQWGMVGPSHPQFALKELLERMGVPREAVTPLGRALAPAEVARSALARAALLPTEATVEWATLAPAQQEAPASLSWVVADRPAEEAMVVALAMRRALEQPGQTVALVTPDRQLARRVASALLRFGIAVDDSAGQPLVRTPSHLFLMSLLEAVTSGLAPVPLLALLKHPLAHAGLARPAWLALVHRLDRLVLRLLRPAPGLAGLAAACADAKAELDGLLEALERCLSPLLALEQAPVADWLDALIAAAEALATTPDALGADQLWDGEAGRAAADWLLRLRAAADERLVDRSDIAALLAALSASSVVRPSHGRHPRAFIWGTLEARLQRADVTIIGGLNEGVWPQGPDVDPYLSEAMRIRLGLPSTEFRIGQAAHDFAQCLCGTDVILTRARRTDQGPAVASRLWLRLQAASGGRIAEDRVLLDAARALDQCAKPRPAPEPRPCPTVEWRPQRLSVTEIDAWRNAPYTIYARRILRLEPLDPVDPEPTAADKGSVIHLALELFFTRPPAERTITRLLQDGRTAFASLGDRPALHTLWWPRFERAARWVIDQQRRRTDWEPTVLEARGRWQVPHTAVPFLLTGKPDRIDVARDGRLEVIDYKTGNPPTSKQFEAGRALQLPLLAAMARAGVFGPAAMAEAAALSYWTLKGSTNEPGAAKTLARDTGAVEAVNRAEALLRTMIEAFAQPTTPYPFRPKPVEQSWGHDYDQLARLDEWLGRVTPADDAS